MIRIHMFNTIREAYDTTQIDDNIRDGDVLIVKEPCPEMEGGVDLVGILVKAWPVRVAGPRYTSFHEFNDQIKESVGSSRWGDYQKSIALARAIADAGGIELWDNDRRDREYA